MLGLGPVRAEPLAHVAEPGTARDAVRAVDAVLVGLMEAYARQAREVDPVFARDVVSRLGGFVQRGGKRLRTAFAWCGWRASGGAGEAGDLLRTGAAIELLQACALVHDDVMDGSALRRGGPALHVEFARMHRRAGMSGSPRAFAASAAVLAGDLALAWADDLLTETALTSPFGTRLHREWRVVRSEMVAGQYLDLQAQAVGSCDVAGALTIATLKSALYTVARPLTLGATLAGANEQVLRSLHVAGRCAGLAFQLRDDLLGAFGDPAVTGKPAGEDLRDRKVTYLLAVALRLADAVGDEEATAALAAPRTAAHLRGDVEAMRVALERTGARTVVEARIAELAASSLRHFARTGAAPSVQREFAALVDTAAGVPSCGEDR